MNETLALSAAIVTPSGQQYGATGAASLVWAQATLGITLQSPAVVPTGQEIQYILTGAGQSGLYGSAFVSGPLGTQISGSQAAASASGPQGSVADYTVGWAPGTGPLQGFLGNGLVTYVTPPSSEPTAGWTGSTAFSASANPAFLGSLGATPSRVNAAYDALQTAASAMDAQARVGIYAQSTFTPSDISTYFSALSIPPPNISVVPVDGSLSSLTYVPGWHAELELDLERVGASAPGANITVYTLSPSSVTGDPMDVLSAVVASDSVSVFAMSFSIPEDLLSSAYLSAWDTLAALGNSEGITFVAASGDTGAYSDPYDPTVPAVAFPASDPNTTAVGGTELGINQATSALSSQDAWSPTNGTASGGGYSWYFPRPAYQRAVSANPQRGVPDVSFLASWPFYLTYDSSFGFFSPTGFVPTGWSAFGGTSASAQTWAGYVGDMAAALGDFGNMNATLYYEAGTQGGVFSDVTVGGNGLYQAGTGWDPVTGLGSVNVDALMMALSSGAPSVTSLSPSTAGAGGEVTVQGLRFGGSQGTSYVTLIDNGTGWGPPGWNSLTVDSWSDTSVTFTVPAGVTVGTTATVNVTTDAGLSNAATLTVSAPEVPAINGLTPSSASAGTEVTLTGTGFGTSQGPSYLTLIDNGTGWGPPGWNGLTINSWSDTAITFTVPAGVSPGTTATVSVTTAGGPSNIQDLTVIAPIPSISSLSPSSAGAGTEVTLTGTGFGASQGTSYLTLIDNGTGWGPPGWNGLTISSWSDTAITFTVPAGVSPGTTATVSVTTAGGPSNIQDLTVIAPIPSISSLSPSSASAGTEVTLTGTGFGTSQGTSYLTLIDNGTGWGPPGWNGLTLNSWSDTAVTFTVPAGVSPGTTATVSLTTSAGPSNSEDLAVIAPVPSIRDVSPSSTTIGAQVTIIGSGFGRSQAASYLTLTDSGTGWGPPGWNGLTVNSWSETAVTFTVPATASAATPATLSLTTAVGPSNVVTLRVVPAEAARTASSRKPAPTD